MQLAASPWKNWMRLAGSRNKLNDPIPKFWFFNSFLNIMLGGLYGCDWRYILNLKTVPSSRKYDPEYYLDVGVFWETRTKNVKSVNGDGRKSGISIIVRSFYQ